jgi:hypothetical protein
MPSSTLNLSELNGTNGFVINGIAAGDSLGVSVSDLGDINGDGIADLIIGAPGADPNGSNSGTSYVVFGGTTLGSNGSFDLSSLDGSSGFAINGLATGDQLGFSVSGAGDINGDGIADLVIGARRGTSSSYVVFGGTTIGAGGSLDLASLNGSNGFALNSITTGGNLGFSVSGAGDINGDGFDDVVIGAPNDLSSYVVFGQAGSFDPVLDLSTLNGSNGFAVNGSPIGVEVGYSVSSAGDVNGDGIDDLLIGSWGSDVRMGPVSPYVVFGQTQGFGASLSLANLDGSNGFRIDGIEPFYYTGVSVSSAGDINGDGFDDLIAGTPNHYGDASRGSSFIVFGGSNVGAEGIVNASTLNGSNGFAIGGLMTVPKGFSVSGAGDINNDGIADLIIGMGIPDTPDLNGQSFVGTAYVVYGSTDIGPDSTGILNVSNLNGSNGFAINGVSLESRFLVQSVSGAGDVNGDGIDDVIIAAPGTNSSYVVFGSAVSPSDPTPVL